MTLKEVVEKFSWWKLVDWLLEGVEWLLEGANKLVSGDILNLTVGQAIFFLALLTLCLLG